MCYVINFNTFCHRFVLYPSAVLSHVHHSNTPNERVWRCVINLKPTTLHTAVGSANIQHHTLRSGPSILIRCRHTSATITRSQINMLCVYCTPSYIIICLVLFSRPAFSFENIKTARAEHAIIFCTPCASKCMYMRYPLQWGPSERWRKFDVMRK